MFRIILLLLIGLLPNIAMAQIGLGDINGNSSLPIDIVSDELVVNSQKNLATFKGGVEAKQGDMILLSDKMKVFYHDSESSESGQNSLSKIITTGNTSLDVPNKKASSDNGIYDVDAGIITMQGNVVLNQDNSQLRGDKFVYNVKSGKSSITSEDSKVTGKVDGKKKKNRVKGVFIPRKKGQK